MWASGVDAGMSFSVTITRNPRVWLLAAALAVLAVGLGAGMGAWTDWATSPAARLDRARDLAFAHQPEAAMPQARRALAELGDNGNRELRFQALVRAAQIADSQMGDTHIQEALGFLSASSRSSPRSPRHSKPRSTSIFCGSAFTMTSTPSCS